MRVLVLAVCLLLGLVTIGAVQSAPAVCDAGEARAFVALQDNPNYLAGTIPASFTGDSLYFARRYNCRGGGVQVRRVGLGSYEVRFPSQRPVLALATAISDEGITASVFPLGNDTVRVSLRGPLGGLDVATRRDVAFSVVIF